MSAHERARVVTSDAQRSGVPEGLREADRAAGGGPASGPATSSDASRQALDAALLAAHGRGDRRALVGLYAQAGDMAEAAGDVDACCFYLTHAYVFALETGAPEADGLHARLLTYGREE